MPDEQSAFIYNDQELLEAAKSIDPKILSHFRLLEQPYRGGGLMKIPLRRVCNSDPIFIPSLEVGMNQAIIRPEQK
jgi:hypothetical protein